MQKINTFFVLKKKQISNIKYMKERMCIYWNRVIYFFRCCLCLIYILRYIKLYPLCNKESDAFSRKIEYLVLQNNNSIHKTMIKKEKPMLSVAAIIQSQGRWDRSPFAGIPGIQAIRKYIRKYFNKWEDIWCVF